MLASRLLASRRLVAPLGLRAMSTIVPEIKKVGVVGLGLMGHGIAQTSAEAGFQVVGVEMTKAALDRGFGMIEKSLKTTAARNVKKGTVTEEAANAQVAATKSRITLATDLSALADCDLVIEAIVEDLTVKRKFYTDLGKTVKTSALFASNTSSIEVDAMADSSGRPDKMVGLHFFNPVQIMKLLEVVRAPKTSEQSFDIALRFGKALGKEVVSCKDTPGFIVNRLLVPYMAQAIAMLERGDASAKDIDTAMRFGAGYPMGPLTLADYVGLDTCLFILRGWVKSYPNEPAFFVPKSLERMVAEGKFGRKSGQGFYKWEGDKKVEE